MNFDVGIPVCGDVDFLPQIADAFRAQQPAPQQIVIVNDGGLQPFPAPSGTRVISHATNLGRGAARQRLMTETSAPFVTMCDAGLLPAPDFCARAKVWFSEDRVGAVFARITQRSATDLANRWRGRHLFKMDAAYAINRQGSLCTGLCLLRRAAVEAVGGFDPSRRCDEDTDLGKRLLAGGWEVIHDPELTAIALRTDSIAGVLRRYARWNFPQGLRGRDWLRQLAYTLKVMVREDLRRGDPLAALLSLATVLYPWRQS